MFVKTLRLAEGENVPVRGIEWLAGVCQEWRAERRRAHRIKTGLRLACPCCGNLTLEGDSGDYDICAVCFWEDDPVQLRDPAYKPGASGGHALTESALT